MIACTLHELLDEPEQFKDETYLGTLKKKRKLLHLPVQFRPLPSETKPLLPPERRYSLSSWKVYFRLHRRMK